MGRREILFGTVAALVAGAAGKAAKADAPASARAQIQHLLRRMGFSAPPEAVSAVLASGADAWLGQQLAPSAIDDSAAVNSLEPAPSTVDKDDNIVDGLAYERRFIALCQRSARQVQMKMTLHWLDHFSVSNAKIDDLAVMAHYQTALQNGALGNFEALVRAASREPAMLLWLDNDGNTGPVPNENFARELMQLYVMGVNRLNADGSFVTDASGQNLANYTQSDVHEVALALTGYYVEYDQHDTNPNTRFHSGFAPENQATGTRTILGQSLNLPNDQTALDTVIRLLVRHPSTAPFQVRELLQRIATETPSAQFIADIVKVWNAHLDDADQLARVLWAIAHHPEFALSYRGLPKQPVELVLQALRQLPGVLQAKDGNGPGADLVGGGWLSQLGQDPYYPPSVFSFYRPGQSLKLVNTNRVLQRSGVFTDLAGTQPTDQGANFLLDLAALRNRIGAADGPSIAAYLLDALLDGGSAAQQLAIASYLGAAPDDDQIRGAIWLLLDTPGYAVN